MKLEVADVEDTLREIRDDENIVEADHATTDRGLDVWGEWADVKMNGLTGSFRLLIVAE